MKIERSGEYTRAQYDQHVAATVPEAAFQAQIVSGMGEQGWLCYHTHDSRGSDRGFPDVTARKGNRLVFMELKRQDGKLSAEQVVWLDALAGVRDAGAAILEVYGAVRPLDREGLIGTLYGDSASTERLHQWCLEVDCERCQHERVIAKPPRTKTRGGRRKR